jgi:Bacterial PH domain
VLWWAWLAFAVLNMVDVVVQGSARFAAIVVAVLLVVTGVVYACALRPRVIADDNALTVRNPFRDHRVPWGSVAGVDVGDWVRVQCAPGPDAASGRAIDSWALFAPPRTRLKAARRAGDAAVRSTAAHLPAGTKRLMSLSAPQVIAWQLDERARRERGRGAAAGPATARWAWPSLAAIAVPALALIIILAG